MGLWRSCRGSAGVRAAVVELAASHADGAVETPAAATRHNGALAQLVLLRNLVTKSTAHEGGAAKTDKAHREVMLVLDAIDSIALPTYLAAEAAPGVESLRDVVEAAEGGVDERHFGRALCCNFGVGETCHTRT